MTPTELEADLKRIYSYNTGTVKWLVWDINKLIWLYKKALENAEVYGRQHMAEGARYAKELNALDKQQAKELNEKEK